MQLINPRALFVRIQKSGLLGQTLSQDEVDGVNAILSACGAWPLSWEAYGLATAYHETAHTFKPIREFGGAAYFERMYGPPPAGRRPEVALDLGNVSPGDGARFYGRGYVQPTGRGNYTRMDKRLGLGGRLIVNPDLALDPEIAAKMMVVGMEEGLFTGRTLKASLPVDDPANLSQFTEARPIINRHDRAELIAGYALEFQEALILATQPDQTTV